MGNLETVIQGTKYEVTGWYQLAQDRSQWKAPLHTIMSPWFRGIRPASQVGFHSLQSYAL